MLELSNKGVLLMSFFLKHKINIFLVVIATILGINSFLAGRNSWTAYLVAILIICFGERRKY